MTMANRTSFAVETFLNGDTLYRHHMPNGGYITVLDRMTGYGYRDIETGYRCPSGQFWLASGHHDIRRHLHKLDSDDAMAEWVIERANNCTGGHHEWPKVGVPVDYLIARENWKPKPFSKGEPHER